MYAVDGKKKKIHNIELPFFREINVKGEVLIISYTS